jgi:hypothetical protein
MNTSHEANELRFECYVQGKKRMLPVEEARRQVWECQFAWIIPLDFYRYDIEGYKDHLRVSRTIPACCLLWGYHVHKRFDYLTLASLQMLDPDHEDLTRPNFNALASRFGQLFRDLPTDLRPIECDKMIGRDHRITLGYRFKPELTRIMIVGVELGGSYTNDDVDWDLFLSPPPVKNDDPKESSAIHQALES